MYFSGHVRLSSFVLPILVVGVLQLSGCTPDRVAPTPPGGVYVSTSAGASFEQSVAIENSDQTIAGYSLQGLFRDPSNPTHIYVAAADKGLAVSKDNGQTWSVIASPLASTFDVVVLQNKAIVISGADAAGQGFILRSLDDGKSWNSMLTIPIPKDTGSLQIINPDTVVPSVVLSLEIDPFNGNRVYAGSNLGTVFAGEQSAKTWRTIYTINAPSFDPSQNRGSLAIKKIVPSPHVPGEIIAITAKQEIVRLSPASQTIIKVPEYIDTPPPFGGGGGSKKVFDVSYIPQYPDALLIGVSDGAVVTRDQGATWVELKIPVDTAEKFNTVVVTVSPTNANRLFVAINGVVYRSEDGGVSWNTFALGLPNHWISQLSIDPSNAARMLLTVIPVKS